MRVTRPLAALALAAAVVSIAPTAALAASAPAAAAAETGAANKIIKWGPYFAGSKAKTLGLLTVIGEDHDILPTADTVRFAGEVYDLTAAKKICGWAVFRISSFVKGKPVLKTHSVVDCTHGTPKRFAFQYHDVYQVELKVCAEPKQKQPSLTCLYAGTWKTLYLSK